MSLIFPEEGSTCPYLVTVRGLFKRLLAILSGPLVGDTLRDPDEWNVLDLSRRTTIAGRQCSVLVGR